MAIGFSTFSRFCLLNRIVSIRTEAGATTLENSQPVKAMKKYESGTLDHVQSGVPRLQPILLPIASPMIIKMTIVIRPANTVICGI